MVTPLTYFSFAWRILWRDRLYTFAYGIAATFLSLCFFVSVRIHINLYGGLSLSSIVSFDQTPQFLFYTSLLSLISLALFHSLHRLGDIGVMMAVGGNRWGCIWLHTLALLFLLFPATLMGFILGMLLSFPESWTYGKEILSFFTGLSFIILTCVFVSFSTIGLTTFVDPYRSIRRQK